MRFMDDQFAIGQRILLAVSAACLLIASVTARPACAEWDAQRPITIIVPFGPGSGIDAGGRFIAESLSEIEAASDC